MLKRGCSNCVIRERMVVVLGGVYLDSYCFYFVGSKKDGRGIKEEKL